MCRSPLLLGPFSVTSNRALEEALAALAIASQGRSRIKKQIATNSDDGAKTRSIIVVQNVDLEVPTPVPNFVETGNSLVSLIHEERTRFQWVNALRLWRIRDVTNCRRGAAGERRWEVSEQSAKLRQKLRQWHLWCRVNWTSLQCVFYVFLFFVLVLFLRVQEEDFAETTRYLRRPN
ncbi:unnamed protein product [Peronospora belbahrii]|nr:unnamed protein product [Peronospora belbahrii]